MEQNFGPLAELVSALVEVGSSVQTACPLDNIFVLHFGRRLFVAIEVRLGELLLPSLDAVLAITIGKINKIDHRHIKLKLTSELRRTIRRKSGNHCCLGGNHLISPRCLRAFSSFSVVLGDRSGRTS